MALHIKADGAETEVHPKQGMVFSLAELQDYVGGYIELVKTMDGRLMWMNEDGKRLQLPVNAKATALVEGLIPGDRVVGDVLITSRREVD